MIAERKSGALISSGYGRSLTLAYPEHLGPTRRTDTLSRWPAILQGYSLGVFHFLLSATFHTVCLHTTNLLSFQSEAL